MTPPTTPSKKPLLHASQLDMLMRCPAQYEFRYVRGIITPPPAYLHIGTATHASVAANLKHKCNSGGQLLPLSVVQDVARDTVRNNVQADGLYLSEDEAGMGPAKVQGDAVDMAVALAKLHHRDLAPHIEPISAEHVERTFVLDVPGLDVDLAGTMDIEETDGIRDTKTPKKRLAQSEADCDEQFTMYALARHVLNGAERTEWPVAVRVDNLVKSAPPALQTVITDRHGWQVDALLAIVRKAAAMVQAGLFPPNTTGWHCSKKWCGYAGQCPYWSGRK